MAQPLLSRFCEPTHPEGTVERDPGIVTFAETQETTLPTIADPMDCRRPMVQEAG